MDLEKNEKNKKNDNDNDNLYNCTINVTATAGAVRLRTIAKLMKTQRDCDIFRLRSTGRPTTAKRLKHHQLPAFFGNN